ncbi:WbqC family protein, partial [bacterium]|nr:WbqC family protein [bacterium]
MFSKRVAILQSNYIPWKGYFDLIAYVDEFILFDDMQFTRRDWRNRNKIKTPNGLQWLTVPVNQKGR